MIKQTILNINPAIHTDRMALRSRICKIKIFTSNNDNYRIQGALLQCMGFSKHEAKYPNDTSEGRLRLEGWNEAA